MEWTELSHGSDSEESQSWSLGFSALLTSRGVKTERNTGQLIMIFFPSSVTLRYTTLKKNNCVTDKMDRLMSHPHD